MYKPTQKDNDIARLIEISNDLNLIALRLDSESFISLLEARNTIVKVTNRLNHPELLNTPTNA